MDEMCEDIWRQVLEYGTVVEAERLRATCRFGRDLDLHGKNGVCAYERRCMEAGVDPSLFSSIHARELAKRIFQGLCLGCGVGGWPLVMVVSCCGAKPLRFHKRCLRRLDGTRYVECPWCNEPTNAVLSEEW